MTLFKRLFEYLNIFVLTWFCELLSSRFFNKKYFILLLVVYFMVTFFIGAMADCFFYSFAFADGEDSLGTGLFIPNERGSVEIPCSLMHTLHPATQKLDSVITDPVELPDGTFERYFKGSRNIVRYETLSYRNSAGYIAAGPEPRCMRSIGTFLKYTAGITKK
jgi:hypothetical protein